MAVEPDSAAVPVEPEASDLVVGREPSTSLVRCGAELVELSERFYRGIFVGALVFVGLASIAALALLPLRQSAGEGALPPTAVVAALLVVAAPLAVWHARALYRALRRRPWLELGPVLVAAALVSYPLHSELWWPSCALLMLVATLAPLQRALAYCLVVLAANLAAHLVAGDLPETPAVAVIGLWVGYPFWSAIFAVSTDRLAASILRLNAERARRRRAPVRVVSWSTAPRRDPDSTPVKDTKGSAAPETSRNAAPSAEPEAGPGECGEMPSAEGAIQRLTARQLQVVALLADGLRYREVAACLSISVRQVQRHVSNGIARAGLRNANELVAVAVSEGIVPNTRGG